jgi:hypothetical protein
MRVRPVRVRGFDKIRRYAGRMKREMLISFLPPVLLSVAIRLAAAANAVFRPDVSIGASQEWVLVLAVLAGVLALIVFAVISYGGRLRPFPASSRNRLAGIRDRNRGRRS